MKQEKFQCDLCNKLIDAGEIVHEILIINKVVRSGYAPDISLNMADHNYLCDFCFDNWKSKIAPIIDNIINSK
jgi:hypothetical protein